ncbi:hypothetical protein [Stenotrophomonas virus Jojan60]|nr:hypothetical protein [Stenotrophomonas virus Jojan60]
MNDNEERKIMAEIVRALANDGDYGVTQIDGWDYSDAGSGVLIVEGRHDHRFFQVTFQGTLDWMDL